MCRYKERNDRPPAKLTEYSKRSCTDVLYLLLFFASWAGLAYVFQLARDLGGDPNRITHGMDFRGRICGVDEEVKSLDYAAFVDPSELYFRVCVADCDATENATEFLFQHRSSPIAGYCLPTLDNIVNGSISVELSGDFESAGDSAGRAIGDVLTAWQVILASAGVALVFAYMWIWLTRYIAGFMVWITILLGILGGFLVGYYMLEKADEYEESGAPDRAKALRWTGIAFLVATLAGLLMIFGLRHRIRIAVAVVKQASTALTDMNGILCFPALPLLFGLGYVVLWVAVVIWVASVGDFEDEPIDSCFLDGACNSGNPEYDPSVWLAANETTYRDFVWNDGLKNAAWYTLFHLFWVTAFLGYYTYHVVSGAISEWYFTPYNERGSKPRGNGANKLSRTPVQDSCRRTTRFHMGSVALGSMIIAIVRTVRAFVHYLEYMATASSGGGPNQLQKCLMCSIHCCLWCVEQCMDRVNKNAYIWQAIWGDNFGTSTCSSFKLVWRNLARAAAIHMVGHYLIVLGKLVAALCTMGLAAAVMSNTAKYQRELSSIVVPCVVVFLVAYMVSSIFMSAFETTIDTTFFCFLVDEEHNKPNLLASPELARVVDQFSVVSKAEAVRQQSFRKARPGGGEEMDREEAEAAKGGAKQEMRPTAAGGPSSNPSSPRAH